MSYYNFNALFGAGQAVDRVRGAKLPSEGPELSTLEEAYTTENWIIRIYKVKEPDSFGRSHADAMAFKKGIRRKPSSKKNTKPSMRIS